MRLLCAVLAGWFAACALAPYQPVTINRQPAPDTASQEERP